MAAQTSIDEFYEKLFRGPADGHELLEICRKQRWCSADARKSASLALAAGGRVLHELEAAAAGRPNSEDAQARPRFMFEYALCDAVAVEAEARRPKVRRWHDARRAAILRAHPEVRKLYAPTYASHYAAVGVAALHFFVAACCLRGGGVARAVLLGLSVGAQCAFGAQALNHELAHHRGPPALAALFGVVCSSVTPFPWFSYYFAGGHERHHAFVGTPRDADGDALFWMWETAPPAKILGAVAAAAAPGSRRRRVALALRGFAESPAGAALWASTCAALLPVAYAYALARCAVDDYAANRVELRYYACDSAASVLTISFLCSLCTDSKHVLCVLLYLSLSAAASVGFAMHPLIAFWLMQHACADDRGHDFGRLGVSPPRGVRAKATEKIAHFQPTISYYGSELWQWLTFQELRHLEHHDFPRIAWTRLPQLENLAPEFYGRNGTYHVDSIRVLLESWLFNGERFDGERFDFACRHALLKESKDGTADPARVNIIWRAHARTK